MAVIGNGVAVLPSVAGFTATTADGANTFAASPSFAPYAQPVLADHPLFYHRFEELTGTTALDSSGNGLSGTLRQGVSTVDTFGYPGAPVGGSNSSIRLGADGLTNVVSTATAAAGPQTFSLELWFRTSTTVGGKLIGWGTSSSGNSGTFDRHVYMRDDGRLTFGVYDGGVRVVTTAAAYNDAAWHHLVATLGGGTIALYVDNVAVGSAAATGAEQNNGFWRIGGDNLGGWPGRPTSYYLDGYYQEVAIYGSVLSAAQVGAHYAARSTSTSYPTAVLADSPTVYWRLGETGGTTAHDSSATAVDGVYRLTPALRRQLPGALVGSMSGSYGVGLDGSKCFAVSGTTYPQPNVFTAEVWFRTTTTTGGRLLGFGTSGNGTSGQYDRHAYMLDTGQIRFGVYAGGSHTITSPGVYNDGVWHLLDVSLGPNGMVLYIDGIDVAHDAATTTAEAYTGFWRMGYDSLSGWPGRPTTDAFAGRMDEFAVYPAALTATRVAAHYYGNA